MNGGARAADFAGPGLCCKPDRRAAGFVTEWVGSGLITGEQERSLFALREVASPECSMWWIVSIRATSFSRLFSCEIDGDGTTSTAGTETLAARRRLLMGRKRRHSSKENNATCRQF